MQSSCADFQVRAAEIAGSGPVRFDEDIAASLNIFPYSGCLRYVKRHGNPPAAKETESPKILELMSSNGLDQTWIQVAANRSRNPEIEFSLPREPKVALPHGNKNSEASKSHQPEIPSTHESKKSQEDWLGKSKLTISPESTESKKRANH